MKLILYILLLKTIESKISFDISADCENPTISHSGNGQQLATTRDMRDLYFIDDSIMKEYVSTYYNNTKPRKVLYTTSKIRRRRSENDTKLNSIHERFNWQPVTLTSAVKSSRVKDVHEGPSIYLYKRFKNRTNATKTVNAGVEMPVAIALETSWYSNDFELNHDFVYDLNVHFNEGSGTTGITHTTTFGKPSLVFEHVIIGKSNYDLDLAPGQNVTAKFSAKVCNLILKAVTSTAVSGNLAVNFKEAVNGRHWLGPRIEDVFKNENISFESPVQETLVIKLSYYFDAKVDIIDEETSAINSDNLVEEQV